MATDTTRMVDDLSPLHRLVLWLFQHESFGDYLARANYIMRSKKGQPALTNAGGRMKLASDTAIFWRFA